VNVNLSLKLLIIAAEFENFGIISDELNSIPWIY